MDIIFIDFLILSTLSPEQFKKKSFSPSSYTEKMRWGQGCDTLPNFLFTTSETKRDY